MKEIEADVLREKVAALRNTIKHVIVDCEMLENGAKVLAMHHANKVRQAMDNLRWAEDQLRMIVT